MSRDESHESNSDAGMDAAVLAFTDSSLFESASAIAIRALALRADRRAKDVIHSMSIDTGEGLARQEIPDSPTEGADSK
jgi:hypothetical protein